MKKNLLWFMLLAGICQSFAQGPYVIYYAIDQMKMEGYVDQPFTGAKSFELMYRDTVSHSSQSFCYTWGCMKTSISNTDKIYTRVDNGYFYEYNASTPVQTQRKAQGRYIGKSSIREMDLNVGSYRERNLVCSEPNPLIFKSDLPRYVDVAYQSNCLQNTGVTAFKGVFKGTMAMVEEKNTYPYLENPTLDSLRISIATVKINAPDFMTQYFKPEEIIWFRDGIEQETSGYSLIVGTYGTKGSNIHIEQECVLSTYTAVVKKFNWSSSPIQINFSPNLKLGKDLVISLPSCTLGQSLNDTLKYNGLAYLGSSSINRIFRLNIFKNGIDPQGERQFDRYTGRSLPIGDSLAIQIKEYLGPNPAGGDIYSCEQFFDSIFITPPPAIRIVERRFEDILCHGDKPSLVLKVEGHSDRYTLTFGDSVERFEKGTLAKFPLWKGSQTYQFKLSDANGCVYDSNLTFKAKEPTKLQARLSIREAPCHDSTAVLRIVAKGGSPYVKETEYRYVFERDGNASETDSLVVRAGTTLFPKVYDRHNCRLDLPETTLSNPADFKLAVTHHTDNSCPKGRTGSVRLLGQSTDQSYRYTYAQLGKDFTEDGQFDSLAAGSYRFYAQNTQGCLKDTTVFIGQPPLIQFKAGAITQVRCEGEGNGGITLEISGGTGFKKTRQDMEDYVLGQKSYRFSKEFMGLLGGIHHFYAIDSLGCIDSVQYHIGTRSQMRHVHRLLNPACAESSDGELEVKVSGGVPPYQSEWLSDPKFGTGLAQKNLTKGIYVLKTTDSLLCAKQDTFVLRAPDVLPVHLEGYPLLCKGQSLELDAGPLGVAYAWSSSKGFKANTRKVKLTEADVYTVKVVNGFGCVGIDTFVLQQSDVELKAEFLVASTVVQGDTVVLVNNNAHIDSLSWVLNAQNTLSLAPWADERSKQVIFKEQGEQHVQMVAYYQGCRDILQKKVLVIDARDRNRYESAIGIKNSIFKSCELFPNPNDGHFELHIELREPEVPVALVLSSMSSGSVLKQIDWKIYSEGKVNFEEDLAEGPYVLHVKVRDEVVALRFLITID